MTKRIAVQLPEEVHELLTKLNAWERELARGPKGGKNFVPLSATIKAALEAYEPTVTRRMHTKPARAAKASRVRSQQKRQERATYVPPAVSVPKLPQAPSVPQRSGTVYNSVRPDLAARYEDWHDMPNEARLRQAQSKPKEPVKSKGLFGRLGIK